MPRRSAHPISAPPVSPRSPGRAPADAWPTGPRPGAEASDVPPSELPGPALAEALAAVGDRWTLLLIAALLKGPMRFGELEERLPGIAPNVLSQRLRHLQEQGLVLAQRYFGRPPTFVYERGARAHALAGTV